MAFPSITCTNKGSCLQSLPLVIFPASSELRTMEIYLQVDTNSIHVWNSLVFCFLVLTHAHPLESIGIVCPSFPIAPVFFLCFARAKTFCVCSLAMGKGGTDFPGHRCPMRTAFWKLWFYSLFHFFSFLEQEKFVLSFFLSFIWGGSRNFSLL